MYRMTKTLCTQALFPVGIVDEIIIKKKTCLLQIK